MDALIAWFDGLPLLAQVGLALAAAALAHFLLTRVLTLLTQRTRTRADDRMLRAMVLPVVGTLVLVAIWYLLRAYLIEEAGFDAEGAHRAIPRWPKQLAISLGVLIWMRGLMRASDALLDAMARRMEEYRWIEPRSLPLYEIAVKLLILGGAVLALIFVWEVDPTPWLGAAGIMGIAVGFAAKDTLANLFAGIFILWDAPYKLGDFILTEAGERGVVTDIGMRSTRILTRDDIEITIPNAVMANSKIVNESTGRHIKRRIRCRVGVAYGSDIEAAEKVLLEAAKAVEHLTETPTPRVRFRRFGDSALELELLGWIDEPVLRGRALHTLNLEVYKRLAEAGIEIPFPQRDVHLHRVGGGDAG